MAVVDDEVVGHVGVSEADIAGRPVPAIGPLGVLPAHQRAGVGSALVHAVVGAAEATGRRVLVLLGSPAYYARFGFRPGLELGRRAAGQRVGRRLPGAASERVRPLAHRRLQLRGAVP